MSFLTDLFEGDFNNLGTDLSHTFSSLANDPTELAETLGVGGLIAAPFVLPELGAAFGIGGAADVAGVGGLTDAAAGATGGAGLVDAATGAATAGAGVTDLSTLGPATDAAAFDTSPAFAFTGDPSVAGTLDSASIGAAPAQTDLNEQLAQFEATSEATAPATPPDAAPPATTAAPSTATPAPTGPAPGSLTTDAAEMQASGGAIAPSTAGAATPAAASGTTGQLSSILSSPYTKLALGAAPLALTLAMGQPQLPSGAQALQGQALQMQQTGLANLQSAQAGILNAGQTAQISQMASNLQNQWLQTLKNQGVQDPTKDARWPQILANIDTQVTAATATLIQNNITAALQETGQAASALTSIAQMQFTADQNFANNIINATKSLGLVAGLGLTTTTKTTTAS
jgi:hypothetical protein